MGIIIKGSIQLQDITYINVYSPNRGATRYTKQILVDLKREIESNTIIVENFNKTPLHKCIDHPGKKPIWKYQA